MADTSLFDLAAAFLDAVISYYGSQGVNLPARQYVSNGFEAIDCESVSCRVNRLFPTVGDPTTERARRLWITNQRSAELAISIYRCVPVLTDSGRPPNEQAIEASAQELLLDPEMVAMAVIAGYQEGDLPGCGGVLWSGWASYGPEGGYAGGTTTVIGDLS